MTAQLAHLENADLCLAVSDPGAEAQSLRTADGQELVWQGDAKWWAGRGWRAAC